MSPELFALIRRYLLMSMVLALGGIVASVWANHDRQRAEPAPPRAQAQP